MAEIELLRVRDVLGQDRRAATYLVDRLWPRGVRKDAIDIDAWLKDVAPSTELRRWFHQEPRRWDEFRERYRAELDDRPGATRPLVDALRDGTVVLLYDARDREHNHAIVLRDWLLEVAG